MQALAAADPTARWLMQAWMLYSEAYFWTNRRVRALVEGPPHGRLIMLDLSAELHPQWRRTHGFFGVPWIYGHLQNFGGNLGKIACTTQ